MKKNYLSILTLALILSSCSSLQKIVTEPTSLETISAVKEVLNSSAFRAIKTLRKLNKDGVDGFVPPELKPVLGNLKSLGLGKEIDKVNQKIGIVSKIMADESAGIINDAVKELKFKDAVKIVVGGENAATESLKQAMYSSVKKRYSTRLETELGKTEATQYWPLAANAYNLFAKKKVGGSLSDFMAERAVDALFLNMGKEESKIRKNPKKLGKAVVTKVFDYYQKKKGKG
ncbi:MAG: DUF4197 domain-containing protein [Saprospiraceae bacterium]